MIRFAWIGCVVTLLLSCRAPATRGAEPARDHEIVADDYFSIATISDCALSPDGQYVAYSELRWEPPAEKRNIDLWVVNANSHEPRRLTFDAAPDAGPMWSPDSKYIYFTSSRKRGNGEDAPFNGKTQVWRVSSDGGQPFPVTRTAEGVGLFDLSGDGKTLYYTTTDKHVDDDWKELREKFSDLQYGHGVTRFSQVWKLDLVSWRAVKLVDEKRVIRDMRVTPDERRIAMMTTPDEKLIVNEGWSRVDVYDADTQKILIATGDGWRDDHPSPYGWLDSIAWSDDGKALGMTVSFDGFPPRVYVVEWSGGQSNLFEVARPEGVSVTGGTVGWRKGSRDLCVIGEQRARARVYVRKNVRHGTPDAWTTTTPGDVVAFHYDAGAQGEQMAVVLANPQSMPDVFLADGRGGITRLTDVNPQVQTWKMPRMSLVNWKGADGDRVEGILELPPDYEPGKPLPLVVEIHGGPTAASLYYPRFWIYGRTLLAAKGYALLSPNYRGSTGYGDKFMVQLIGRENDIEVEDIQRGIDAMVDRGIADPKRIGVMGWSNGGYLTNCLITTPSPSSDKWQTFAAASSGAGVLDQVIQWSIEDTPGHVINYMQGLPWAKQDAYRAGSPLYQLQNVKTPTLIHVGEKDERVPAAHAQALYRALKHYLNVPTELVVYPGEGHGLTTYENRKAKMEWDLAWFKRYLRGETEPSIADDPKE